MRTSTKFDFVQGDTLSYLNAVLADEDTGVPIDLTGGTALLRYVFVRLGDGAVSGHTDRSMEITDAPNGACRYQFQASELLPGTLRAEVSATTLLGKVITTKRYTEFAIRARL